MSEDKKISYFQFIEKHPEYKDKVYYEGLGIQQFFNEKDWENQINENHSYRIEHLLVTFNTSNNINYFTENNKDFFGDKTPEECFQNYLVRFSTALAKVNQKDFQDFFQASKNDKNQHNKDNLFKYLIDVAEHCTPEQQKEILENLKKSNLKFNTFNNGREKFDIVELFNFVVNGDLFDQHETTTHWFHEFTAYYHKVAKEKKSEKMVKNITNLEKHQEKLNEQDKLKEKQEKESVSGDIDPALMTKEQFLQTKINLDAQCFDSKKNFDQKKFVENEKKLIKYTKFYPEKIELVNNTVINNPDQMGAIVGQKLYSIFKVHGNNFLKDKSKFNNVFGSVLDADNPDNTKILYKALNEFNREVSNSNLPKEDIINAAKFINNTIDQVKDKYILARTMKQEVGFIESVIKVSTTSRFEVASVRDKKKDNLPTINKRGSEPSTGEILISSTRCWEYSQDGAKFTNNPSPVLMYSLADNLNVQTKKDPLENLHRNLKDVFAELASTGKESSKNFWTQTFSDKFYIGNIERLQAVTQLLTFYVEMPVAKQDIAKELMHKYLAQLVDGRFTDNQIKVALKPIMNKEIITEIAQEKGYEKIAEALTGAQKDIQRFEDKEARRKQGQSSINNNNNNNNVKESKQEQPNSGLQPLQTSQPIPVTKQQGPH